jgi:hypothetical protein
VDARSRSLAFTLSASNSNLSLSFITLKARNCGEKFWKLCDTRVGLFHLLLLGSSSCLDIQEWLKCLVFSLFSVTGGIDL